jgi:hypothetical protein
VGTGFFRRYGSISGEWELFPKGVRVSPHPDLGTRKTKESNFEKKI